MQQNPHPKLKGPKGTLLGGCAESLKNEPLDFLERCQAEFGNVVPLNIGPYKMLFIAEPELIQSVLVTDAQNFIKDAALNKNREFFGNGLLSSEGDYWKRQRKLAAPAFSPKRLEAYSKDMVAFADKQITEWQDGQVIEIQHEMMELTLKIVTKALFDSELGEVNQELEDALTSAQRHLADRMNEPLILMLPEWLPFPTNVQLHKSIEIVDKVVYGLIAQRRGKTQGRNDLLSILLSAQDTDDGSTMTDKQIRDEVFTLFFAGHETTALTLTWTLYLLALNPEVEAKLYAEIKQVLGGKLPTIGDYINLPYTEKVIKESLRLRPPVWAIGREAVKDCFVGEYPVEKGSAVLMSQWIAHRDKRYFANPECFLPERWTEQFTESLPKFAYFPFGGGPRVCIGNTFAMVESVLILATIVQRFHLDLVSNEPVELSPAVTLRTKYGIKMKLTKRGNDDSINSNS